VDREREPLPTHVRDTPTLPPAYDETLRRGLTALRMDLDEVARTAIDDHVRLLLASTEAINLTSIRDPAEVALRHVIDSLTAVGWLRDHGIARLLDLGSGGGFPGVPIAAALPTVRVVLLEPIAKKARFLANSLDATGLAPRVTVARARAEEVARDRHQRGRLPAVTARAIASLADLVELAFPLLADRGSLIAWKRGDIDRELSAARRAIDALGGGTVDVHDVPVADLPGHLLIVVTRTGRVPDAFPREPAVRRRRPW
jgi:16S rRNA (guanine527-N7)-methyltransferase